MTDRERIEPTLGMRIEQARRDAGLSQIELGERLGISGAAVSKLEHDINECSQQRLEAIARATGRSLAYFQPTGQKPDLATVLLALYPTLTMEAIRSVEVFAAWLASEASTVPPSAPHNGY